jgi:hypothetical protein
MIFEVKKKYIVEQESSEKPIKKAEIGHIKVSGEFQSFETNRWKITPQIQISP